MPDGFLRRLLLRRRDQLRVVEQLFQEGRRIAVRGLFHVAPLVPRDFDEETPGNDGTRPGLRDVLGARVLAAMLMPDHLHAVVSPRKDRDAKLGNFSGALKRWMREELNASWNWQPGCFDRLLRSNESLHEKWIYVQENPVRAGLVRDWKDWPYRVGFE